MNKRYILKLFSRDSLKTMGRSKKKYYKLLLTALATNLFTGNILHNDAKEIVSELEKLLEETLSADGYDKLYQDYHDYLVYQLEESKVFKLVNEDDFQNMIEFTRLVLNELIETNVSVHTKVELEKYMDIAAYTNSINENVSWIGINFETGIFPFIPEKFIWNDHKVLWNIFANYKKEALDNWADAVENNREFNRVQDKRTREVEYIAGTLERSVLVNCITFVESYLYNFRIFIKDHHFFKRDIEICKLEKVLQNDKINDLQIIEDILFVMYPQLKDTIHEKYKIYKELLKLRDRYIHISIRENGDRQPEMSSLLSSQGLNIEMRMKFVLELIDDVNNTIFESSQIDILWWRDEKLCDYMNFELYKIV